MDSNSEVKVKILYSTITITSFVNFLSDGSSSIDLSICSSFYMIILLDRFNGEKEQGTS